MIGDWQRLTIDKGARARQKLQTPSCLWLTGLSGAGKSTIANLLEQRLFVSGRHTYVLDGDNIRRGLSRDLGYSEADRVENMRRAMEVAHLFVDAGLLVIVAFISPFRAERDLARSRFAPGEFVEIYIDAPLEECERRDPKGLYAKARRGEVRNFTGIDSDYQPPKAPKSAWTRLPTVRTNASPSSCRIWTRKHSTRLLEARTRMTDPPACEWLTALLPPVMTLAREAGRAILAMYQDLNPQVEYKPDHSPVTQADRISHQILQTGLARLAPDWPVLSEESVAVSYDERKSWRHFWMIDPLDGTREFLHRTGEFTVNVALIEDDRPVLGVIYAPVIGKLYFAACGTGCYRMDGSVTTPIGVAPPPAGNPRVVVSRRHALGQETPFQSTEVRPMGSSLKFCLIAEGAADVYPRHGPTWEWDTAAAQCILEEAGGTVTDLEGNSIRYNKPDLLNSAFVARARTTAGT